MTAHDVLRAATTILLVDWPSREVPNTLARAGFDVVVHGGPAPDDYSRYVVEDGEVVVRQADGPPKHADLVYSYRPLAELPRIVEQAQQLAAGAVWVQLAPDEADAARSIVEAAGLRFVGDPHLLDVRSLGEASPGADPPA